MQGDWSRCAVAPEPSLRTELDAAQVLAEPSPHASPVDGERAQARSSGSVRAAAPPVGSRSRTRAATPSAVAGGG